MEKINLKYGEKEIEIKLTGAKSVRVLQGKALPAPADPKDAFLRAIGPDCIDSRPLGELISAHDLVTVIVSDITRFWMRQDQVSALLIPYLHEELGVPYENIVILVAVGTHRPQTEEELKMLVSPEIYTRVKVLNHNCLASDLAYVGETSRGNKVYVNPLAVGRKVIAIGGTIHHLMSGYGGGRKSILPGIAGKSTITFNHIHCLAPDEPRSNPLIGMGNLQHNPVNEDMNEAAALVAPVFGINVVKDFQTGHVRLICGDFARAWEESCRVVQDMMGVPIDRKADIVVVSCGGYPKDINLYQAVKSLFNAGEAVKEGGRIIFLAEGREGGGTPDYFSWIEPLRQGTLDADLRADFTIGGYIFYASCEVMARAEVHLLTEIPAEILDGMGFKIFSDAASMLKATDFTGRDVIVMPYGGYTVPFLYKKY